MYRIVETLSKQDIYEKNKADVNYNGLETCWKYTEV